MNKVILNLYEEGKISDRDIEEIFYEENKNRLRDELTIDCIDEYNNDDYVKVKINDLYFFCNYINNVEIKNNNEFYIHKRALEILKMFLLDMDSLKKEDVFLDSYTLPISDLRTLLSLKNDYIFHLVPENIVNNYKIR